MTDLQKSVLMRFVRGGIAGAVGVMLPISAAGINNFHDLQTWITALGLAGASGFITGLLMALDKYLRASQGS